LGDRTAVEGVEAAAARAEGARRPHGAHRRLLGAEERHDLLDRADHVAVGGRVARRRDALEPATVAPADGRDARQVLLAGRLGLVPAPEPEPEPHAEPGGQHGGGSEHDPPASQSGRRSCQSVACWYAWAARSTIASSRGRATSASPTGRPATKPHGTLAVGRP